MKEIKVFREKLIEIWKNEIKEQFSLGRIVYERQLQAFLFHFLMNWKSEYQFEYWVEPVWYINDKAGPKPDLVVTLGTDIISIIELKWLPWSAPHSDIKKLMYFKKIKNEGKGLILKAVPNHWDWNENKKNKNEIFTLHDECLMVFAVCGWCDSKALTHHGDPPSDLLHLIAHINENSEHHFGDEPKISKK